MEPDEEIGENSTPSPGDTNSDGRGGGGNRLTWSDVYNRLVENHNEEVNSNPDFRQRLEAHFNRLPPSYMRDIDMDRVEDVLIHQKLLVRAKDHDRGLALKILFLQNVARVDGFDGEQILGAGANSSNDREEASRYPIHEIIFSTVDKPKLLSQLSALVSVVGLNIREGHVFSTTDGYSLEMFVVDGWHSEAIEGFHGIPNVSSGNQCLHFCIKEGKILYSSLRIWQDTRGLYGIIRKAFSVSKESWSGYQLILDEAVAAEGTYDDWEIDWRFLKIWENVYNGSHADLFRGLYLGQDVAVKVLKSEHLNDSLKAEFAQELSVLREVQHENVVCFIGACTKLPNLCIVTEYMSGGSLYEYLQKNHAAVNLPQLLKFAIDVCKGMEYLHWKDIIHRDLKSANLLIDSSSVVKVADFGIARAKNTDGVLTPETGTYRWMAPEVLNHQAYNQKADVYSFSIVLWELLTAKMPYDGMTSLQAAFGVKEGRRPEIPENAHPKIVSLMTRCWDPVPDRRPSFSEIKTELEALQREVNGSQGASTSG